MAFYRTAKKKIDLRLFSFFVYDLFRSKYTTK